MRAPFIALVIALIAFPATSRADEAVIALKDLEQEALKNNPEIGMAGKRVESTEEKKSLAAAMPDPMIGYEIRNVGALGTSTVGEEEMSMQGVVFTQEIPFPGKLSTKGNAARKQAEREQDNARETRLRVLSSLRSAYYDYHLAYRSSEILEQNKVIMKNFQRIAETRYATGQGIQQDVLRAQLEVSMLLEKLAMQEQKKESQRAMINSLLGRDPRAPLGRPGDRLVTTFGSGLDELTSMAVAHSPSLSAKHRMVEQSEYELSMSRREYLPDMVVSGGWFTRGELKDVYEASVMLRVPLYFWNKSTGVKAASADLGSARYEYESVKLMTISRVKDLYTMAKTSERLLNLYDAGILPQARLALQSAASNYQVGKIDFLSLLESQSVLLKYQLQYEEELVNLNKTVSMISEVTGEDGK
jgi:outer membrane protein TolC